MKTKTLLTTIVAFTICGTAFTQSWEQQYQQADAELNRVYKELRSNLSEQQKAELKKVQLAWLKEKVRLVKEANTPVEQLRVATNLTIQRTAELKSVPIMQSHVATEPDAENPEAIPMIPDREASKLIVGKWAHYHGSKYENTFIFKSDGSFNQETVIQRAGVCNRYTGSWRIKNGNLILHKDGEIEASTTEIRFNNRNSFTIEEENTYDREN
jgi:hypothetical protein